MTGIDPPIPEPRGTSCVDLPDPDGTRSGMPRPDTEPASFLLVFNDPATPAPGYGLGWTLTAWLGGRRAWALPLAGRGAGAGANGRIAQAVAVRVLSERGVFVAGWNTARLHGADHDGEDGAGSGIAALGAFRARLPVTVNRSHHELHS